MSFGHSFKNWTKPANPTSSTGYQFGQVKMPKTNQKQGIGSKYNFASGLIFKTMHLARSHYSII